MTPENELQLEKTAIQEASRDRRILRRDFLKLCWWMGWTYIMTGCGRSEGAPTPTANPTASPKPTAIPTETPTLQSEATKTPTPRPGATQTPESPQKAPLESTPEAKEETESLFRLLLQPFVSEAQKRRLERAGNDPEYARRIDQTLNYGRINFLLFFSGETHEPPLLEWGIIASPTIVSVDYMNGKIDIVSLTHDLRAPEIEEVLGIKGQTGSAQRLDQALLNTKAIEKTGKFRLPQLVLEEATGLSIDFQIHSNEITIQELIDGVFHGITIDVPIDMPLAAYYFQKIKYDTGGRLFRAGKVTLSGREAVGFIKAIPQYNPGDGKYSPLMEHNVRKAIVFEAILESFKTRFPTNEFKRDLVAYIAKEQITQNVTYDFPPIPYIINNLGAVLGVASRLSQSEKPKNPGVFPIDKELYVVDWCCTTDRSLFAVHWADWIGQGEEELRKDLLERKVYQSGLSYEVPYGANPYRDLITEYWQSVRFYVRQRLLGK